MSVRNTFPLRAVAAALLAADGTAVMAASGSPAMSEGETPASSPASFSTLFTGGAAHVDFRYRYEYVDEDGFDKEAEASTLRSRLTLNSGLYRGFSGLVELDDVTAITSDKYNSTDNGKTEYPVVADPEGSEINQALLKFAHSGAEAIGGRQRINHGSERFIGGVGWRQNEQTYDGFRATYKGVTGLVLDYAYVDNVNRVFGPDDGRVQPGDLKGDNHFIRVDWTVMDKHVVMGFAYLLDIDLVEQYPAGRSSGNSSDTYGLEYSGVFGPVQAKLGYATQSGAGDNPADYDADWYFAEAIATLWSLQFTLGYEVLGAGDNVGFKTPYATLHKFQGWADKFLVTPDQGIEDLYAGIGGAIGPVKLAGYYHGFQAEDAGGDYGTEIDLVATWTYNEHFNVQLKYAGFDGDAAAYTDTDKAWVTLQFKY